MLVLGSIIQSTAARRAAGKCARPAAAGGTDQAMTAARKAARSTGLAMLTPSRA
jgi:hypothetical protein